MFTRSSHSVQKYVCNHCFTESTRTCNKIINPIIVLIKFILYLCKRFEKRIIKKYNVLLYMCNGLILMLNYKIDIVELI